jgi:8-oxo-dGTP pyrophosphatase MutT (NUDIX family)
MKPIDDDAAETLSSEVVLKTRLFEVRKDRARLPGRESASELFVIGFREACSVVALDDKKRIALIRQYRYPIKDYLWELPAGIKDDGESREEAALRELEEEAGLRARSITPLLLGYYQMCSIASPMMNIFLAEGLTQTATKHDELEIISPVEFVDLDDVLARIGRGEIKSAFTIVGALLTAQVLQGRK